MQQQFQQEEPKPDIAKVVERLNSGTLVERVEAQRTLQQIGPNAVENLMALLKEEGQKRRRRRKWIIAGVTLYIVFMLLMAISTHNFGNLGGLGGMTGLIVGAYAASQKQKHMTKALAQIEDIRSVGLLVEALEFPNMEREERRVVEETLTRLLLRLQASDAGLLDAEQRAVLNRTLAGKKVADQNKQLLLAILKAFEQVGDEKALPIVEKLARGEAGTARINAHVRDAAEVCLPFLQKRIEQENASHTLLRASSAVSDAAPETLLRPAEGVSETDPHELLRATSPTE